MSRTGYAQAHSTTLATVACPDGLRAVGGGGTIIPLSKVGEAAIIASRPNSSTSSDVSLGWAVEFDNLDLNSQLQYAVDVICAPASKTFFVAGVP